MVLLWLLLWRRTIGPFPACLATNSKTNRSLARYDFPEHLPHLRLRATLGPAAHPFPHLYNGTIPSPLRTLFKGWPFREQPLPVVNCTPSIPFRLPKWQIVSNTASNAASNTASNTASNHEHGSPPYFPNREGL